MTKFFDKFKGNFNQNGKLTTFFSNINSELTVITDVKKQKVCGTVLT